MTHKLLTAAMITITFIHGLVTFTPLVPIVVGVFWWIGSLSALQCVAIWFGVPCFTLVLGVALFGLVEARSSKYQARMGVPARQSDMFSC